jgi:hypothetical protein
MAFSFFNLSVVQNTSVHQAALNNSSLYLDSRGDERNTFYAALIYSVQASDELQWQNLSLSANGEQPTVGARYNPIKDAIEIMDADKIYEIAKRHNLSTTFAETSATNQSKSFYS